MSIIPQKIYDIIIKDKIIRGFVNNIEKFEILFKRLTHVDIERLAIEYPNLLNQNVYQNSSIICLTLIKRDISKENYTRLKKIKIYIDEKNEKVLKIMQS